MRPENRQAGLIEIYLYIHLRIGVFPVFPCAECIDRDSAQRRQFINILLSGNLA